MANIVISELRPAGSELFMDSESYLTDLNEQEMMYTGGGPLRDFFCTGTWRDGKGLDLQVSVVWGVPVISIIIWC